MSLTGDQWRFLAARLLARTDKEAAAHCGIAAGTVANWKLDEPEFVQEYEAAFADGVHVAKTLTRKALGKAAQVLVDALDAKDGYAPDWRSRLKAVEIAYKTHGLLREKVDWTPDLSGLSDEEITNLARVLGRVTNQSA